jgi:hypothetical protein
VASLLTTLATIATGTAAHAEREIGLGVAYDPRIPVGSFRDVIPNVGFAGVQAKWDYYPLDALSTGVEVQYQLFQRDTDTTTVAIPNGAVTAPTFRYASFWSVLPTVRYYFSTRTLRPYAALGAGVSSATRAVLVSDVSQRDVSAAFIVQPSIGVLWRLSPDRTARPAGDGGDAAPPGGGPTRRPLDSMFGLTAALTYAFTTADFIGASNIGFAGIQLGVYAKP